MPKTIYSHSKRICVQCQAEYLPSHSKQKYCSRSCSATHTNKQRPPRNKEYRIKISRIMIARYADKQEIKKLKELFRAVTTHKPHPDIWGIYSIIWDRKCQYCKSIFYNRKRLIYCKKHEHLYKKHNKKKYSFTFNPFNYLNLFDLNELQKMGFYHPKNNPYGLTRDHKVSINESILNDYDSYYITHPLNCELMSMKRNNIKHIHSSISYNELIKMIHDYEYG